MCKDEKFVRDTFWMHPESNASSNVLIIDSLYKTNKYRIYFLEIVVVTSIEMTYSISFLFLNVK